MEKIHGAATITCKGRRKTTIKPTGVQKDAVITVAPQYTGSTAARLSFSVDGGLVNIIVNAGTLMEELKRIIQNK